jgi:hypothetical protein
MSLLDLGCDPELPLTLFVTRPTRRIAQARDNRDPIQRLNEKKDQSLDLQKILSDLTAERDRITRAIEALLESPSKRGPKKGVKRKERWVGVAVE